MNTLTIPAQEAADAVVLTLDEAYDLANKKIDFWRNFRTAVDRLRNEQTASAVVGEDPELTKEEQEVVKAAAVILSDRSENAREVKKYLEAEAKPRPIDVIKVPPVKDPVEEPPVKEPVIEEPISVEAPVKAGAKP